MKMGMIKKLFKTLFKVFYMSVLVILGVQVLMFLKMTTAVQVIEEEIVPWRLQNKEDAKFEAEIRILNESSMCSAVVISDHYALSAAHCSDTNILGRLQDTEFVVFTKEGLLTQVRAKFVAIDGNRDVALLKGNFSEFKAKIPNFNYEAVGYLQSCGFPANGDYHCEELYITGNEYFRYRARGRPLYPGMSGGGTYDYRGYLVAINSSVGKQEIILGPLVGVDAEWGIQ